MTHLQRKIVAGWLWTGAGLIFLMLVIGGITRLTGSGLSMTDWNLIMGAIPPTNLQEWKEAFEQYKQFPEYQQLNYGMSLWEFQQIFFWEYLHRLLGRFIGIVFLIPFLWFWFRGYFNSRLLKRMFILFGMGALQGAMGWIMVKSGLVDNPYVSHYRLAAHLILAFLLIGLCVWFALDLRERPIDTIADANRTNFKKWAVIILAVFFMQVFWGALTAGLDAGLVYNTFPLMSGSWIPRDWFGLQALLINFVENPGTVQWMHRILGTLLTALVIALWIKTRISQVNSALKIRVSLLLGVILMQYILGIFTLLYRVPVALGVAHQAVAMLFWVMWLIFFHKLKPAVGNGGR